MISIEFFITCSFEGISITMASHYIIACEVWMGLLRIVSIVIRTINILAVYRRKNPFPTSLSQYISVLEHYNKLCCI